jgi:hypothetical protein
MFAAVRPVREETLSAMISILEGTAVTFRRAAQNLWKIGLPDRGGGHDASRHA